MNENQITYPSSRDLKTILIECVRKSDMIAFLRSKGIFFINATTEAIAIKIASMVFDVAELDTLRSYANRNTNKQIFTGFNLCSHDFFDLSTLYDLNRNDDLLSKHGYKLKSLSVYNRCRADVYYEGSVSYTRKTAGKMEFIRCEERDVRFIMRPIGEKHWQVEIDAGKSVDGKNLQSMFKKMTVGKSISLLTLDLDYLSVDGTINFFDSLAKEGLGNDWELVDVERITLRKRNVETDDEENNEEAPVEQLSGITQAILEGRNLRENSFVHQAEESGYMFASMTYLFQHKHGDKQVKMKADFKGNPKIFEVLLESYSETGDRAGVFEDVTTKLSEKENLQLRTLFWNNAKRIFNSIKAK